MTLFSIPVSDPLWKADDKIIPKEKDCIEFWKKTLQSGQQLELYEIFEQTTQDVLFRAQIQTVSDIDVVAFIRFLCYIGSISVELIEPEPEEPQPEYVQNEEIEKYDMKPVEMSKNEEEGLNDICDNEDDDGDEEDQPNDDSWEPDEEDDKDVSSNQVEEKEPKNFPCGECEEKFLTPWDYDIHYYTNHAPQPIHIDQVVTAKRGRSKRKHHHRSRKRKEECFVSDVDKVANNNSSRKFQSKRLRAKYRPSDGKVVDEVLNRDCPKEIRDISKVFEETEEEKEELFIAEVSPAATKGLEGEDDDVQHNAEETNAVTEGSSAADASASVGEPESVQDTEIHVANDSAPKRKRRSRSSVSMRRNQRSYPCQVCSEQIFGSQFKSHMKDVHQLNSEVRCLTCNRIFYSHDMLLEHVERHRAHNLQKYTCSICGKNLKNIYTLEYHQKSHSKPEKCSLCHKTYTTPGTLKRHMVIHTQETRFKCKYCPKQFYNSNKCVKHEASHQEKTLQCSMCDQSFHFKSGLESHMQTHNPDRELVQCDLCKKSFKTKGNLMGHIRQVHQKQKIHPCNVCGIKFAKTSTRKRHESTHTDVKPYQCEICGKNFREKGHLKRHVEWHKGEQKHQCDVCGRLFSFKDNMLKHRRIHTGETPYSCDLCSQSFTYVEQLKKHKKKVHTIVMSDEVQYETTLEIPCKEEEVSTSNNILSDAIQACLSLDIESTIEVM